MYGKKWVQRGKKLRVEIKYRTSQKQRVVQVVRIPVPTLDQDQADDCIRQWLLQRRKFANPNPKPKSLETMFMQAVDSEVIQRSYHAVQDMKKRKNFGTTAKQSSLAETSPASIDKLKRARYAQRKRHERQAVKHKREMQVTLVTTYLKPSSSNTYFCHNITGRCKGLSLPQKDVQ